MRTNEKRFFKKQDNIVFYVSEMDLLPSCGHFHKMDATGKVILQLENIVGKLNIMKYSEYNGETLKADSVGIIFPTYRWGISLAVQGFLKNLKISENVFLYVVIAGNKYELNEIILLENKMLVNRIKRMLENNKNNTKVYLRCIEGERTTRTDSECKRIKDISRKIDSILESIQYYTEERIISIMEKYARDKERKAKSYSCNEEMYASSDNIDLASTNDSTLENIFLDDKVFEGVRLCRAV